MSDTPVYKYTVDTSIGPIEGTVTGAVRFFIDGDRDCQFLAEDKRMVHFVRTPLRVWKADA